MRISSQRGQLIVVLLATLEDLRDEIRIPSKREVEQHIEKCGYLKLSPELLEFYPSKPEPKWKIELAWARNEAKERGYIRPMIQPGAWEITEQGIERLAKLKDQIPLGGPNLERFDLWSAAFRKRLGI